jgi:phospholipid-binding lipoprotein MlaA
MSAIKTITKLSAIAGSLLLSACFHKGTHPDDPFEPINRKTHAFNMVFDKYILKPPAKVYKAILPPFLRAGINNAYNNVNLLPTVANDLLQADFNYAIKDTWRFIINSTFGIAGVVDVASTFSLPPHSNDLGLTFAKWGDKNSPYFVIPLLGPSTIRDGMGMMFDYALFTPYPYINSNAVLYSLLGVRYVDLRSQMFDTDRLIDESFDKYTFIRDAYLQHRHYLITGEQADNGSLYVGDEDDDSVLGETPENGTPSDFPLTTAKNATHSAPTT